MERRRQQGDVVGDHEVAGDVPARAIGDQRGVHPRINGAADLGEVLVDGRGVATRNDKARTFALLGADRAKDIGGGGTLVLGRGGSAALARATSWRGVVLADAGFVLPPEFDGCAGG